MNENKLDYFIKNVLILSLIWAGNEVFLGPWLKSLNIVLSGSWLSFFSVMIVIVGKKLVPTTGSIITIGIITAFLKFLLTGFSAGIPFFAVLIQALIAELVFLIFKLNKVSALLTSILIFCYTAFHPVIHGVQLLKSYYYILFRSWLLFLSSSDGVSETTIRFYYLIVHVILGIISGFIAWYFSVWLLKRVKES